MADTKVLVTTGDGLHTDLGTISAALTSTFTSPVIVNDGRLIWKLKVVVSAVSGTTPTLTPQLAGSAGVDGVNYNVMHQPYAAITVAGTYWFLFDVDPSDSIVNDRTFKIILSIAGTTPSFTITSLTLYGIRIGPYGV